MNIANISVAQLQEIHDFLAKIDCSVPCDIKDWLENNRHKLSHILCVTETIWTHCCDPDSSIVELNQKFKVLEMENEAIDP